MPIVSFIIPYHNEPIWMLRESLDSILALGLDVSEREVIVIDDGSDVSPFSELQSYADIICLHQQNQGPGAARNYGMSVAKGDYIQFVDADDRLLPDYRRCLDIAMGEHPDIVMFHGNATRAYRIDATGTDFMLHHNMRGAAWCLMFRKAILRDLRYDSFLINEDELFNAQLMLHADCMTDVGVYAYFYRPRSESRSHSSDKAKIARRLDDALTIICRLRDMVPTLSADAQPALHRRVAQLTMDYIYNAIVLSRSISDVRHRVATLRRLALYPLPLRTYTFKYLVFAVFSRVIR